MRARVAAVIGVLGLAFAVTAYGSQPPPTAVTAPVRVVRVSWGSIGYRVVGKGRPLVLLVGEPGSIDSWSPSLLDALAGGARVYAMDYEGIGRTTLRSRAHFTITRLADDTADFIRALHLAPADVMGWSFGSVVAQSLAVRYPTLVRRLVLAATAPGDGSAKGNDVSPPAHYSCQGRWWLFPFNAKGCAAAIADLRAIHAYPDYNFESKDIVSAIEDSALDSWLLGLVKEGHRASAITTPVLVGDGTQDAILPMPDSANVANAIPHATLKLYSDAGHGFLFQHAADWSRLVLHFLDTGGG